MAACHESRPGAPPACAMDFSRSERTDEIRGALQLLREECTAIGRDPAQIEITCGTANLPDFKGRDARDWVAMTAALGADRVLVPLGYMNLSYDRDGLTKGLGAVAKALGL